MVLHPRILASRKEMQARIHLRRREITRLGLLKTELDHAMSREGLALESAATPDQEAANRAIAAQTMSALTSSRFAK
jgi:hypothetical protein